MSAATAGVALNWLLDGIAPLPATDVRVEDLTLDSRAVRAGTLFFALSGAQSHGLQFAEEAAARGACAVLWDPVETDGHAPLPSDAPGAVFSAPVTGLRRSMGRIADRFFGRPSSHLRIVGITGTNGKTTCAYLLAQCLERLKHDAAYVGTIGWGRIDEVRESARGRVGHTTADVITTHRQLAALRASGVREVAMEVSSHALAQGRVDGVRFHCSAFTNLTRDHLDYHGSMAAYGAAKARLFAADGVQHWIINVGDAFGRELATQSSGRRPLIAVWVGAGAGALQGSGWPADRSMSVNEIALDLHGMSMEIGGSFGNRRVDTKLLGRFNAENSVVVLGCLLALGLSLDEAADGLMECTAPPGRMEMIESPSGDKPLAIVDYAHTPDALAKALSALREHCRGALWCVFGCGGDRDPGKRPLMGTIADDIADHIIITDDNPRSEAPQDITRAIAAGIRSHQVRIIHDRAAAITAALREAAADDMVLIAGKGHEDYQIYGDTRRSFSDRSEAARCLGTAA